MIIPHATPGAPNTDVHGEHGQRTISKAHHTTLQKHIYAISTSSSLFPILVLSSYELRCYSSGCVDVRRDQRRCIIQFVVDLLGIGPTSSRVDWLLVVPGTAIIVWETQYDPT